ncbi:MAG: phosphoribosylamine--glycine ligase, partial [Candidatus Adiutrix sp.]|nr:phosphoribosylamine--glycine ligase [Candidatus Adiutrix sp.]
PITETPAPAEAAAAQVFHAGTTRNAQGTLVTNGGRVLTVAATDATLEGALSKVYRRIEAIHFQGATFRRDIAHRELARRRK